jgi:hypothetical protein
LVSGMEGMVDDDVVVRCVYVELIDICFKIILMIIDSKLIIV